MGSPFENLLRHLIKIQYCHVHAKQLVNTHTAKFEGAFVIGSFQGSADGSINGLDPSVMNMDPFNQKKSPFVKPLRPATVEVCSTWLHHFPGILPKHEHLQALSTLTNEAVPDLENWFASLMRHDKPIAEDPSHSSQLAPTLTSHASTEISSEYFDDMEILEGTYIEGSCSFMSEPEQGPQPPHFSQLGWAVPDPPNWSESTSLDPYSSSSSSSLSRFNNWGSVSHSSSLHDEEILAHAASCARDLSSHLRKTCKRESNPEALARDPSRQWQCTRCCGRTFTTKKDWARHEELAFPQKGWVCLVGRTVTNANGTTICSYCPNEQPVLQSNDQHFHSTHSNSLEHCRSGHNKARGGGFYRYQHFVQHFKKIHPGLDPKVFAEQCHFEVENSQFPRNCGFCSATFTTWRNRIDHISEHFEFGGLDMRSWDKEDESTKNPGKRYNHEDDNHPDGVNNGSNGSNDCIDDDNGDDDSGPSDVLSGEWLPEAPEPSGRGYPMPNRSFFTTTVIAAGTNTSSGLRTPSLRGGSTSTFSTFSSFSLPSTNPSTDEILPESDQNGILIRHPRTPPAVYPCTFPFQDCQKTTSCKGTWQTTPPGAENAVTYDSLLPLQVDYAPPNSVRGDSTEAWLFEIPRFTELPSDPLASTLKGVDESNLVHYSWRSASDDMWSDGNYSLTSPFTSPSVANNEIEVSKTVFPLNETETAADRVAAPSSEDQTTQMPVPSSESIILVPKKRRSVSVRSGLPRSASNEQVSNSRREKRNRTKEELDNSEEVNGLIAGFRCRLGNGWVSYILLCQRYVLIIAQCSAETLCNSCIKDVQAHGHNVALRILDMPPPLKQDFFWAKCKRMEQANQAVAKISRD